MYGRNHLVRPVQTSRAKAAEQQAVPTTQPMPPGETEDTRMAQGHHKMGQYAIFPSEKQKEPVQKEDGASSGGKVPGASASGSGAAIPDAVREKMEQSFGESFGNVRVHQDGAASSIGATAYTQGSHIHFQPGRFSPNSDSGQKLLGHELTHVVQQRHGQVAVPQGKGLPINADNHLESEADTLGEKAARGQQANVAGAKARKE